MPPQQPPYAGVQPMNPADEKLWAILVHVGGIFFGFIPALVVFLVTKDRGPFVRAHSATALNFQITLVIAAFVGVILAFLGIGILILLAVYVLDIVLSIIAAVKASQGQWYTYPVAIRFVS